MTSSENHASQAGSYASVNGLEMYYEVHGIGQPLVLIHGGLGATSMFGEVLGLLSESRQVIAVDLQGHGRTADIDRPLSYELMGDDVAALIKYLAFEKADVMGYSLGGQVALQAAIRHPEVVRKLVVTSAPFKRDGWYPEILVSMEQMSGAAAEAMRETPMYQDYVSVAPKPENFPVLLDKGGALLRQDYDWTKDVTAMEPTTMLVFGDADSIPPTHAVEFFGLLGGGKRDAGLDGSGRPSTRLAILPATTHYDIFSSPALASAVTPFLDATTSEEAESSEEQESDLPSELARPAQRALTGAGIHRLDQITRLSETEVRRLHGMGPKALEQLRRALAARGQSFAREG